MDPSSPDSASPSWRLSAATIRAEPYLHMRASVWWAGRVWNQKTVMCPEAPAARQEGVPADGPVLSRPELFQQNATETWDLLWQSCSPHHTSVCVTASAPRWGFVCWRREREGGREAAAPSIYAADAYGSVKKKKKHIPWTVRRALISDELGI